MASSAAKSTLGTKLRYAIYIGSSSTVLGSAAYLADHTQRMNEEYQQRIEEEEEQQQQQLPSNSTAASFSFIENPQRLLRRLVLYWYAKGTVLKVGAGTGRDGMYHTIRTQGFNGSCSSIPATKC